MLWELPETRGLCEKVWVPSRPRAVRTSQEMLSLVLRALLAGPRRSHLEGQSDPCAFPGLPFPRSTVGGCGGGTQPRPGRWLGRRPGLWTRV